MQDRVVIFDSRVVFSGPAYLLASFKFTPGVYKFNRTNFQEISRRFQEGFQEKSRTCLHCFGLLYNEPNLLVCLNIEQNHDMHNMAWDRGKDKQESRAVAGNPRDAAVIFDP